MIYIKEYVGDLVLLCLIVGVCVWLGKGLWLYSYYNTHDGLHHIARSYDAIETFAEGHFPLRWAGSLNYQCGAAVYTFFYPLLYYVVIAVNYVVGDVIRSLTWIYWSTFFVSGIGFYLWARLELRNSLIAFAGTMAYLLAPYRLLLIYVRGSPEFMSYALLPIFLAVICMMFRFKKYFVILGFLTSIIGGLFVISHNFTVMFLFPLVGIYVLLKFWVERKTLKRSEFAVILFGYLSSLGVAAFFLGPAILELEYVQIGKNITVNYLDHFPTLGQLIRSPWGYFYSMPGVADDGESFMLGYGQWFILFFFCFYIFYFLKKRKSNLGDLIRENWIGLALFIGIISVIYLILPWSIWLWRLLSVLQSIQFSWRLLGVAVFLISCLWMWILHHIDQRFIRIALILFVSFLLFYGNRNHLLPFPVPISDAPAFADFENRHYHRYSSTTLGDDILGIDSQACTWDTQLLTTDSGTVIPSASLSRQNTYGYVTFSIPEDLSNTRVILGLEYFPGIYKITINDKVWPVQNCGGHVCFEGLPDSEPINLHWQIIQSPTKRFFNYVTLATIFIWGILILIYQVRSWFIHRISQI